MKNQHQNPKNPGLAANFLTYIIPTPFPLRSLFLNQRCTYKCLCILTVVRTEVLQLQNYCSSKKESISHLCAHYKESRACVILGSSKDVGNKHILHLTKTYLEVYKYKIHFNNIEFI